MKVHGLTALLAPVLLACGDDAAGGAGGGAGEGTLRARIGAPPAQGAAHLVRMVAHGDRYAFEPAGLRVAQGDEVRFVMTGAQPESVAFDTIQLAPEARAWTRERGLARGPLLTRPGQVHAVSFRAAPPGRYPFFSVPHAAAGMRGVVVVTGD